MKYNIRFLFRYAGQQHCIESHELSPEGVAFEIAALRKEPKEIEVLDISNSEVRKFRTNPATVKEIPCS